MYRQYDTPTPHQQAQHHLSHTMLEALQQFFAPAVHELEETLDARLVRTFLDTIIALIVFRDRAKNLLLSELGAFIASPEHAPAGTKRLSSLLRSSRWHASLLERFLWRQATSYIQALRAQQQAPLVLWDESTLEKPESSQLEGLGSVRSSKARRLTRIKPGYYQPPKGTVFVPGMQWLGLVVVGLQQPAVLAGMQWWTTRGKFATHRRCEELWWLGRAMAAWGRDVVHIFDRGFAGQPWLEECCQLGIRFVMRWPKGYLLSDHDGWVWNARKAWMITRGKRSHSKRMQWSGHLHCWIKGGVLAVPVHHPKVAGNFWLVVSRPGKGQLPWYLLTNEEIRTEEEIWEIVYRYARRWQIEMTWRYTKSELGFESPRSWTWEARQKLLMIATMAFAFLLSLLQPCFDTVRGHLLKQWCPRTGERFRQFDIPLYRLREALSFLWLYYPPSVQLFLFSG